jgi:hypothetical protein
MPFPLNYVFLRALAQWDLLSTLALANTSKTLHDFIYETVLGTFGLISFLRRNQYALHHDSGSDVRLFTKAEIGLLLYAFKILQMSQGELLYQMTLPFIGPLISCLPWNSFMKVEVSPQADVLIGEEKILGDHFNYLYKSRLDTCWMHRPFRFLHLGGLFYLNPLHDSLAEVYLKCDMLFCKDYVSDLIKCQELGEPWYSSGPRLKKKGKGRKTIKPPRRTVEQEILGQINIIRAAAKERNFGDVLEKHCLTGYLFENFCRDNDDLDTKHKEAFQTLFNQKEWMQLWDKSELGAWYAFAMAMWGYTWMEKLIAKDFSDLEETLVWLFLGAHGWGHPPVHMHSDSKVDVYLGGCCHGSNYGEVDFLKASVSDLSKAQRLALMRRILRRAPEYGACRYLGAYIFQYIVCLDMETFDEFLSVLLYEIVDTKLQSAFEFAVSTALSICEDVNEEPYDLALPLSKAYRSKLIRRELRLFELLS